MGNPDYAGGTWGFVDIDLAPYLGKTEKITVTARSLPTAQEKVLLAALYYAYRRSLDELLTLCCGVVPAR